MAAKTKTEPVAKGDIKGGREQTKPQGSDVSLQGMERDDDL